MSRLLCFFLVLLFPFIANAANCKLNWTTPTTNVDTTFFTDLAEYRIYAHRISGGHEIGGTPFATTTETTLNVVCDNNEFWVVTAVDTSGNESIPSNEVFVDVIAPSAPTSFVIHININISVTQ